MNLLELTLIMLPAYLANSIPVFFTGKLPMDLGKKFFDGKRIFGDGKTFKGFIAGVTLSTMLYIPIAIFLKSAYLPELSILDKIALAFLLSIGALTGDFVGSFIKRRIGLDRGESSWLMDQLLFIFVAIGFAILAFPQISNRFDAIALTLIVTITFFMHLLFNQLAYRLKLKSVPW